MVFSEEGLRVLKVSLVSRMSETPTTTTSRKSIAIRLQFVITPSICIAVLLVPYGLRKGKYCQYSSHVYRSAPLICIAIRLPFVSQYFWENIGGCGHRDVPHLALEQPQTCTSATLGLLQSERDFRDSWAFLRKDYLHPSPSDLRHNEKMATKFSEKGEIPGNSQERPVPG